MKIAIDSNIQTMSSVSVSSSILSNALLSVVALREFPEDLIKLTTGFLIPGREKCSCVSEELGYGGQVLHVDSFYDHYMTFECEGANECHTWKDRDDPCKKDCKYGNISCESNPCLSFHRLCRTGSSVLELKSWLSKQSLHKNCVRSSLPWLLVNHPKTTNTQFKQLVLLGNGYLRVYNKIPNNNDPFLLIKIGALAHSGKMKDIRRYSQFIDGNVRDYIIWMSAFGCNNEVLSYFLKTNPSIALTILYARKARVSYDNKACIKMLDSYKEDKIILKEVGEMKGLRKRLYVCERTYNNRVFTRICRERNMNLGMYALKRGYNPYSAFEEATEKKFYRLALYIAKNYKITDPSNFGPFKESDREWVTLIHKRIIKRIATSSHMNDRLFGIYGDILMDDWCSFLLQNKLRGVFNYMCKFPELKKHVPKKYLK